MKISLLTPDSVNVLPWIPVFESKGVTVITNQVTTDCDFI